VTEGRESVAVIGTGVIGAAWAALFLSRGWTVHAHDPAPEAEQRLRGALKQAWPALESLGAGATPPWECLHWHGTAADAVADVTFVQESGPERLDLKHALIGELDRHAPAGAVIASSSSGLRPSLVAQGAAHHPERVLIGHPFHPAHLVPLVEVVPGERTSEAAIASAMDTYTRAGKRPIHVRLELDGHLVNRLQAALWREAYDLVARGAATVADIDAAITNGPGLRWALVGPFAGQHLSGGDAGIAHTLEHLGPPMVAWWDDLRTPAWTDGLTATVAQQMVDEMAGTTSAELSAARDSLMLSLLAAKAQTHGLTT
jgi:3-hydroxyacyl-CoA dehydrogenase